MIPGLLLDKSNCKQATSKLQKTHAARQGQAGAVVWWYTSYNQLELKILPSYILEISLVHRPRLLCDRYGIMCARHS
jgi:hypothetical protein